MGVTQHGSDLRRKLSYGDPDGGLKLDALANPPALKKGRRAGLLDDGGSILFLPQHRPEHTYDEEHAIQGRKDASNRAASGQALRSPAFRRIRPDPGRRSLCRTAVPKSLQQGAIRLAERHRAGRTRTCNPRFWRSVERGWGRQETA
jgi:hypothetical protein